MRARRLAEPDPDRIAAFRMKPKSHDRIQLDLCGQDGRRIGKSVKLTARDLARVLCATQALAVDGDAWLALPRIWREASAVRGDGAVADVFELSVDEELTT
jgi:hypothetical protein